MSIYALEKALFDLNVDRPSKQRFRDDPVDFCSRYQLSDDERARVVAFDVRGLVDLGVNPMLTMGYWLELEGSRSLGGYIKRMRAAPEPVGGK
ncbi:MAG: extradiol ring-cleavage dioxygenase [Actinomycetia bacterium]|nr:extradiol ring-cleavage dioxygenase [Actinomycetes bacterium]